LTSGSKLHPARAKHIKISDATEYLLSFDIVACSVRSRGL
jgi:hypothetical protein